MKIYLAHPIGGLSGKEVFNYYDKATTVLRDKFDILSPMTGKDYLRNIEEAKVSGYTNPISKDHAIFQRDTWMVSSSDIILCDFTGSAKVSIGCCMELAIASWLNKHTVVVMDSLNVHNHAFVFESADFVFNDYDDAIEYLLQFNEVRN